MFEQLFLKANGDTVVHVGTIAEDGAMEVVNTLTKVFLSLLYIYIIGGISDIPAVLFVDI